MPEREQELMTPAEVSARVRVAVKTLEGWRYRGEGPPWFRAGSRAVRYRRQDVDRWLEQRVAAATGGAPAA
jgi:predicted DNA-binding transcriptional regulator AlpA